MSAAISLPTEPASALYAVPSTPTAASALLTKFCPLCQTRKPLTDFLPDRRSKRDGRRWYCMTHKIERAAYGSLAAKANEARYQDAQHEISLERRFYDLTQTLLRINETAEVQRQLLARRITPREWFLRFRVAVASAAEKLVLMAQAGKWTLAEALRGIRNDLDTLWNEMRALKRDVLEYRQNKALGERALLFWERNWRYIGGVAG